MVATVSCWMFARGSALLLGGWMFSVVICKFSMWLPGRSGWLLRCWVFAVVIWVVALQLLGCASWLHYVVAGVFWLVSVCFMVYCVVAMWLLEYSEWLLCCC